MEVRPQTQIELAQWIPQSALRIAESGIQTAADIAQMRAAGYHAFLVGESLMSEPNPSDALAALLEPETSLKYV
jgi:indole-3-glycerol phosphate synthase